MINKQKNKLWLIILYVLAFVEIFIEGFARSYRGGSFDYTPLFVPFGIFIGVFVVLFAVRVIIFRKDKNVKEIMQRFGLKAKTSSLIGILYGKEVILTYKGNVRETTHFIVKYEGVARPVIYDPKKPESFHKILKEATQT